MAKKTTFDIMNPFKVPKVYNSPLVKKRVTKKRVKKKPTKRKTNHKSKKDFPKGKGLDIHIVIYVPSTSNVSKKISTQTFQRRIRETANFLSTKFGGATRVSDIGYWVSDKKGLVKEKVAKVECFTKRKDYYRYDMEIEKWIEQKKKEWGQEAISYEFEEALFFP